MNLNEFIDQTYSDLRILRDNFFSPFARFLSGAGITANHITNLRLVLGVLFFIFFFSYPFFAIALITVAWILDGIDGPLARVQKSESAKGKFLDIFVDLILYALIAFTLGEYVSNKLIIGINVFVITCLFVVVCLDKNKNILSFAHWKSPVTIANWYKNAVVFSFYFVHFFSIDFVEFALVLTTIAGFASFIYHYMSFQR